MNNLPQIGISTCHPRRESLLLEELLIAWLVAVKSIYNAKTVVETFQVHHL